MAINTLKNSCFTFIIFSVTEDRESLARLEVQNRALSQQLRCRVCHQAAIDTILMPCRHLVVCETCTRSMTSCPLCQDTIRAVVRVHVEWSGKTYNDSDIHFMIDLLLWVVPNSKCCFCGHSLCDCSLQQLKLQTGSITATLSSIVLVGTPSEYLSVLRYNPPTIPNKQAWELSAKMQILMAVKLTFHGEKYVVRGEKRSVVQKKKKKRFHTEYPWNIWSTFTCGYYPSWSHTCEHSYLLNITLMGWQQAWMQAFLHVSALCFG